MRRFLLGLIVGLSIAAGVHAYAAGVFGQGYLNGWTVTKDGEDVCDDPYVYPGSKEIECD